VDTIALSALAGAVNDLIVVTLKMGSALVDGIRDAFRGVPRTIPDAIRLT
jgi:hypothetical protein